MKKTYKNAEGHTESYDTVGAFFWSLLFGFLYFLVKRCWAHAAISFVVAVVTGGLSWLVYPFFASSIVEAQYLRDGWTEVKEEEVYV